MLRNTSRLLLGLIVAASSGCQLVTDFTPTGGRATAGAAGDGDGGADATGGTNSRGGSVAKGGTTVVSGGTTGSVASGGSVSGGTTGSPTNSSSGGVSTVGGTSNGPATASVGGATSSGGSGPITYGGSGAAGGASGTAKGGATTGSGGTTARGGSSSVSAGGTSSVSVGGSISGGTTTRGGSSNVTAGGASSVSAGGTSAGGTSTATTTALTCAGTLKACGSSCVDTSTDKANCGSCGFACEGYQFCDGSKCLPTYVSTKVLPMANTGCIAPTAGVALNKAQGDVFVQFYTGTSAVTLSDAGAPIATNVDADSVALARYTASGVLVWGRNTYSVLKYDRDLGPWPMTVTSAGDVFLAYRRHVSPGGLASPYQTGALARIGGANGNVIWDVETLVGFTGGGGLVYRAAKNDSIVLNYESPWGSVCQVVPSGSTATATDRGAIYARGIAAGADGSTLWSWGANAGTLTLSPWSTQTWTVPTNPTQGGGSDAFIIGSRDDGSVVGPWFTEGDFGPEIKVAVDPSGDLLVAVKAFGYTTFNGGQELATTAGNVLLKIRQADGAILWRQDVSAVTGQILAGPGNRVLVLEDPGTGVTSGPMAVSIYSGQDGRFLSKIQAGTVKAATSCIDRPVSAASGTTDLFLVGGATTAADFNPGTAVDTKGATPGVFISRYSF